MVTRGYRELQEVTMDYRGFKGMTVGTRGDKRFERVTAGYNWLIVLQGVLRG